jgi:dihydroorotate dehydrogenase
MKNGYERLIRPLLFAIDPETAHRLALSAFSAASHVDLLLNLLKRFQPRPQPKSIFGLNFPNPIGLAAGLDKNGVALPVWEAFGFGFIEIGTVTAKPQPGNSKPRIFRFPEQRALINRLGFNNDGADVIAQRLAQLRESGRWPRVPVGINIGKSRIAALAEATDDYLYSFRLLREFADYIVLNVSSPNTPALRELQGEAALSELLSAIAGENDTGAKPIFVKIAPDLSIEEIDNIVSTCEAHNVAGIVATNTTVDHSGIPVERDEEGGLSGTPLLHKSTAAVQQITKRSKIPVIASGGIMDAEAAREKIAAGARLLQVYTGFIYRGPGLLRDLAEALQ